MEHDGSSVLQHTFIHVIVSTICHQLHMHTWELSSIDGKIELLSNPVHCTAFGPILQPLQCTCIRSWRFQKVPYSCAVYSGFSEYQVDSPVTLFPTCHSSNCFLPVCACISGCVGAMCWCFKHAVVALPLWKPLHVCRETVLFSPLSMMSMVISEAGQAESSGCKCAEWCVEDALSHLS